MHVFLFKETGTFTTRGSVVVDTVVEILLSSSWSEDNSDPSMVLERKNLRLLLRGDVETTAGTVSFAIETAEGACATGDGERISARRSRSDRFFSNCRRETRE